MEILGHIKRVGRFLSGATAAEERRTVLANQRKAMHEVTQLGTRLVKGRTPQGVMGAQGGLLGSIQPEVRNVRNGVIGIIGTANPYGLVVEKGRRPGQKPPPADALVRWIEVKMGVSTEDAKKISHPVRWKIAKKGTAGAHMFEKTLEEDWAEFQTIFDRYGVTLSRELNR
ncbi:MAG: hypothetical protein M0036_04640 [Desulfobacteraceae bacterium]|nr:hypothetical protein [Desulfobacteraceae bacterium]